VEAERLLDALEAVEGVERRHGVEDHASAGVDRIPPDAEQLVDILLLDAAAPDLHLDAGDAADQAAGREADENVLDIGGGDPLGLLDRLADGRLGALHVGDEAALDAPALALAGAEDTKLAVLARLGDQGRDL
jgi:hypothetical protein